ncbi:MAG: hypothetical protein QM501_01895 [Gimesia sp.]
MQLILPHSRHSRRLANKDFNPFFKLIEAGMPEADRKGIFIPAWVIACIFSPIVAGGVGAITWTTKTLIEHSHQLIEIDEKLDSNKELLIEMVSSHERRISRLEDRVFGKN